MSWWGSHEVKYFFQVGEFLYGFFVSCHNNAIKTLGIWSRLRNHYELQLGALPGNWSCWRAHRVGPRTAQKEKSSGGRWIKKIQQHSLVRSSQVLWAWQWIWLHRVRWGIWGVWSRCVFKCAWAPEARHQDHPGWCRNRVSAGRSWRSAPRNKPGPAKPEAVRVYVVRVHRGVVQALWAVEAPWFNPGLLQCSERGWGHAPMQGMP